MKRLLFVLLTALLLTACGEDVTKEKVPVTKEKEVQKELEQEVIEEEPLDKKIEINKTIELNGATIVVQSLRVKDDSTQLYGYWNHNSQYDEAHLGLLVTTAFEQNGKELEVTNSDKLLEKKKKTIDGSFALEVERIDNSPIELKIIANTDEMETETITIDIP